MRRHFGITLTVLAVCVLVGNVALAQGRGRGGRGMGMGGPMLLMNEQVQKELKVTDEQKTKIGDVLKTLAPPAGTNPFQLPQGEREAYFAEMQKKGEAAMKTLEAEVFTAEQTARLKQVQLWVAGSRALTDNPELIKALKLTDDQTGAIKTVIDESDKKRREVFQSLGQGATQEERAKAMEKVTEMNLETEAECMAVLTDDQKAQLDKMKGPKFQLDMSQFRRGRGN